VKLFGCLVYWSVGQSVQQHTDAQFCHKSSHCQHYCAQVQSGISKTSSTETHKPVECGLYRRGWMWVRVLHNRALGPKSD